MPSTDDGRTERTSRRRLLSTLATGLTAATAGCAGSVPEQHDRLTTTQFEDSSERIAWDFQTASAEYRTGYAALRLQRRLDDGDADTPDPTLFQFNASLDLDNDFEFDWYRARISTPTDYHQRYGDVTYRVTPPGQWEDFCVYFQRHATRRELVVEHRGVDTEGTILTPVVVNPVTDPFPPALRCQFTLQASKSGAFGRTIRIADSGQLVFESEENES
ncbi:hypothetical protein SAMN04487949_1296 [Halogranum gelatinilyticum]|uniref:Uncharacterized protein n=1 Tax=Halogranum gelatinilyticum TaxID=660521 RepID=A0A1G9RDD7_9EURY|nr:hypothetical protein [Halogranum gelatinilyticum]SDM21329.1 hypothetical protein SAMN04487949_1296 [Halogranum gelatinilyticum]